jgi:hypothetical protein
VRALLQITANLLPFVFHRTRSPSASVHRQYARLHRERKKERKERTNTQLQRRNTLSSNQIPHPQHPVHSNTERDPSVRVGVNRVDASLVTLETAKEDPVADAVEGDGGVGRGGEEHVTGGDEAEGGDGACVSFSPHQLLPLRRKRRKGRQREKEKDDAPIVSPSKLPTSFLLLKSHTLITSSAPPLTKYFPPTFLSLPVPGETCFELATVRRELK